jgi:hypothetical protein
LALQASCFKYYYTFLIEAVQPKNPGKDISRLRRPGGRFLKKLPRVASGPPTKTFIKEGHGLQPERNDANHDRL